MPFAFDGYVLDLDQRELRRGGAIIALEPRAFDLLAYLVHHRTRVVGKDELFDAVWEGRIVSDAALTTRINAVRRAIGDNGTAQRLIRTLRRKGLRFIGDVTEFVTAHGTTKPGAPADVRQRLPAAALADRVVVTVLPFAAISDDAEGRRLADGVAEDLVTALACFRWLAVIPPPSRIAYPHDQLATARIGCGTDRAYVVQGAVRCSERRVRVTARLVDATVGSVEWTDRFDGLLADGLSSQGKIASMMAGGIEARIQSAEARRCKAAAGTHLSPYDLRLQAHPIFSSGRRRILRALALLEQAIELDRHYAPALADAANCRQILDVNGWAEDRRLNRDKAIKLARLTLRASSDPEPVAIAAFVLAYFSEDTDAAVTLLDDALRLNPNFATGWYMNGMARLYAGQPEQAIDCFQTSIQLNPRDRIGRRNVAGIGFAYLFIGRYDDAVAMLRPIIHEFPRWATPYCVLASCHAHLGFLRESEAVAKQLLAEDAAPVPNAVQFRDAGHRELLRPGLKLLGMVGSIA
jgi:DNA-binding winged helix-turn-helix (wHTH) protein/tetratricopeptide (TPR) repeat protein